jgi:hypothetical protein
MVNHPTKACYILKDKIQALLEAGVMTLQPEHKKVTTNMVTVEFGQGFPKVPVPCGVVPVPRAEMRIINSDPHQQEKKGMVQYATPSGQSMWVHPDLLEDEQWTSVTSKRSKGKGKACHIVSASLEDEGAETASLTDSDEDRVALTTQAEPIPAPGMQTGK